MADKNFGVKGLNLVGQSETPSIVSPSNLNINAITVAISTDLSIGGKVTSNIVVPSGYSVGIGTTVLTERLNVNGNANISGIVSASSFVGSGASLTGLIPNALSGINSEVYQYFLVSSETSGSISSLSISSDYIIFNPSAKYLGIGTDSPAANIDVVGTGNFTQSVTSPSFLGTATTATNLADAANITTGTISSSRLSGTYGINITGTATTANNLSDASNISTGTISSSRLSGSYNIDIDGTAKTATTALGLTSSFTLNTVGVITAATFVGNLTGIASTATNAVQLQNERYFSVSGDVSTASSVAFNGTQNVGLAVTLALSGVTSGTYGSSTSIPSITVNNKGIITGVTTSGITVGDGTLDLKTSGTGLSGIATFTANQATGTAVTFTVSSNATSANTANAIVSRDASGNFSAGIITATTFSGTATTATALTTNSSVNTTGIITAATFSTGISTQNIGFTTGLISGPNTIFISPYAIGITTGTVRILGNLQVDGTTVTTVQQTIQSSAKTVGVAVSETNNISLDGSGITIGSTSIQKTLFWNFGSLALKSSENFNLALGKVYQINDNEVLSSTTLANSVVTSGLTTVGTLRQLIVSNGTSTELVRITQTGTGNALVVEDETNPDATPFVVNSTGSVGVGTTNPLSKLHVVGDGLFTGTGVVTATTFVGNLTGIASTATNLADAGNITTGTISSSRLSGSYGINITGTATTATNLADAGNITTGTISSSRLSGTYGINITGTATTATNLADAANITTGTISSSRLSGSYGINITGTATTSTTANNVSSTININTSGVITATTFYGTLIGSISTTGQSFQTITIAGLSTFTNGPVLIGSTTTTGTESQPLQVTGGAYVSGSVGIGITTPTEALDVVGNINSSGTITAQSDERIKTNIKTIKNALEKVISIRGVEYDRIDNNEHQIGVIAQEVEKIIPEVVYGKETKSVAYGNLVGLLIEAVKELKAENDLLKEKINEVYKKVFESDS